MTRRYLGLKGSLCRFFVIRVGDAQSMCVPTLRLLVIHEVTVFFLFLCGFRIREGDNVNVRACLACVHGLFFLESLRPFVFDILQRDNL